MLSSKDAIKKKFTEYKALTILCRKLLLLNYNKVIGYFFFLGIKHEWQVNGLDDIKDRSTLGEKLGGNVVVSLEGKPL